MLELLTGAGLAAAAGLNAYIPLLAIGLASRFLDFVSLPAAWTWLENEWVLGVLGVLLVVEFVADKIPAVDTVNDWVQTVVRPTAGGLVFGSGSSSETAAVTDPSAFFSSHEWVPIVSGIVIALGVHLAKMAVRPLLNVATLGIAAPVASVVEDSASVLLAILAMLLPLLLIVVLPLLVVGAVFGIRAIRRRRRLQYIAVS